LQRQTVINAGDLLDKEQKLIALGYDQNDVINHLMRGTRLPDLQPEIEEPYKIGTIKPFEEGDLKVNKRYLGNGEWEVVSTAPRYKPETTINLKPEDKFENERKLSKEFQAVPEVKDFPLIESQVGRLNKAMKEAQGEGSMVAVDQALITILNKMLDPSSVVRESEYARTPSDMGILNRVKGKFDKLVTGGAGLTSDERVAIARMARKFYEVAKDQYSAQVDYYKGVAKQYDLSPERVVRLGGEIRTMNENEELTPEEAADKFILENNL